MIQALGHGQLPHPVSAEPLSGPLPATAVRRRSAGRFRGGPDRNEKYRQHEPGIDRPYRGAHAQRRRFPRYDCQ